MDSHRRERYGARPARGPSGQARPWGRAWLACVVVAVVAIAGVVATGDARADHAMALGYTPKYPADFHHFDYANPDAPKGGELVLAAVGSFDRLNPYLLKGNTAAFASEMLFETLTEASLDEPITAYGLLADDMKLADDKMSVTFHVNPKAKFNNGASVTAADVKYSFETLTSKRAHPQFALYYADVKAVTVLDPLTVRFDFAKRNAELHIILGQFPVFSKSWGGGKPFDQVVMDTPIGSGPYLIEDYDLGKFIRYKRSPNYWGRDLPTRRGLFNFDRVTFRYYRDTSVRLEAFKAGEFDFIAENAAKKWAKEYNGDKFKSGQIRKAELPQKNGVGIQGFIFNTRKAVFRDKRVRKAIALAFDFEWSNRNLFYMQYTRDYSYFSNTEMAAEGLPGKDEVALLEPWRAKLPAEVFGPAWRPPTTAAPHSLRANLREAKALLESAGWSIRESDARLVDAGGVPLSFEIMIPDKAFERIIAPFARNLEKLGIQCASRLVDPALFQRRRDRFEFDSIIETFGGSQNPGNELTGRFTSRAADEEGSENVIGVKDPVVDFLVQKIQTYDTRAQLLAATRALDRVLTWGEYLVPNWYIAYHRVAYYDKFGIPKTLPLYYQAEEWMLRTWWAK